MLDIKTSAEYFSRTGSLTNFSMLLAGIIWSLKFIFLHIKKISCNAWRFNVISNCLWLFVWLQIPHIRVHGVQHIPLLKLKVSITVSLIPTNKWKHSSCIIRQTSEFFKTIVHKIVIHHRGYRDNHHLINIESAWGIRNCYYIISNFQKS